MPSQFERHERAATKFAFEIQKNQGESSIEGHIICGTFNGSSECKTRITLQSGGWGGMQPIYLNQEQGLALAEQLLKIFSQGE